MKSIPNLFFLLILLQLIFVVVVYLSRGLYTFNIIDMEEESHTGLQDKFKLLNLTNFQYKIHKNQACKGADILLLVLVSSAPPNFDMRSAIRETWGRRDQEVKVLFVLGAVEDDNIQKLIEQEDSLFGDIIQGNFVDSYRNMTYKSTMSLKYVTYNCLDVKFVLKCDDDFFVNMPLLKHFLKTDLASLPDRDLLFCTVNEGMVVIRNNTGELRKWYVRYDEWSSETYPVYCAGFYVIMKPSIARKIYYRAQNTSYFWIDDVFLTGMATEHMSNLTFVDMERYTLSVMDINLILNNTVNKTFLFGGMNMYPDEIQSLWTYVSLRPVLESLLIGDNIETD